ncbi:2Fe-2S iron-sulfur cluster-binding protein [Streptomyces sp. NPDC057242]|uniref:2Fe-2S iron-sulfur cluster-binding protein n=1 Tax=unclassified Streptomyces TaxID=2593676 RepID=UPI0036384237
MSSDEQQGNQGGWEPIPQSEGYDGDATAFVQLPPDFMLDGVPLEAPGHDYVPPMITPLQPLTPSPATDPAATGSWSVHLPVEAEPVRPYFDHAHGYEPDRGYEPDQGRGQGHEPDRGAGYEPGPGYGSEGARGYEQPRGFEGDRGGFEYFEQQGEPFDRSGYGRPDPHATAGWGFAEPVEHAAEPAPAGEPDPAALPAPGPGDTGQWQIPAEAPATLPGGAPAPWALREEPEPGAGAGPEPETAEDAAPEAVRDTPDASGAPGTDPEPETAPEAVQDAPEAVREAPEAVGEVPEAVREAPGPDAPAPEADPAPGTDAGLRAETVLDTDVPDPVPAVAAEVHASTDSDEHPHTSYTLRVNGVDRPVTGSWIGESLLYVLRERLGLAGAKDGCSQGECGACNVQVDGRLVASCLVPAATAAGSEVRTVEGLAADGEPSDVQRAMARCGTVQCGFCIPGMCMTVHDLLEGNHAPTELETRQALAGNLCRCSGYRGVLEAVRDVVAEREAGAAAHAPESADEARIPHQIPHPHDGGKA